MSSQSTCEWVGKTGRVYSYFIWTLPVHFEPEQAGNYIYSRKNAEGRWVPIYIGQGDLGDRVGDSHHRAGAIRLKGATHVHVHLNRRQTERLAEEQDLLNRYMNAYHPVGCNERVGG